MMTEDRFLKRLRKKARKGMRGWPMATIAFYGPNLSQATKVAVGIMPSENAEVKELRNWKVDRGDVRADSVVAREILEFMEKQKPAAFPRPRTQHSFPGSRPASKRSTGQTKHPMGIFEFFDFNGPSAQ